MQSKLKLFGLVLLAVTTLFNLGVGVFLFMEQGNIYQELKATEKALTETAGSLATVGESLGQTVEQLSVRESVALERRNSIKITDAKFGEDILEVTYKLGSDLASITKIYQDWGDHTQRAKVDNIPFDAKGQALTFQFTPVVNPKTGTIVLVIEAQSATLGKTIQVETDFDLKNRKVTQSGPYTKEPL